MVYFDLLYICDSCNFLSCRVLQLAVDEERECSLSLKAEVETLSEKVGELQETNRRQTADLSRENEILRNQLKKYVAAVQLLKRENKNISAETNDGTLFILVVVNFIAISLSFLLPCIKQLPVIH